MPQTSTREELYKMSGSRGFVFLLLLLIFTVTTTVTTVAQQGYRLAPGDEVRVNIVGRSDASGTYRIARDGTIASTLFGRVTVADLTLEMAADAVRRKLGESFKDPEIVLEIASYRPIYVMGDVARPGQYPFVEGMTALKAVAAAGGYRREADNFQVSVLGLRASESLQVARHQLWVTEFRVARLQAELKGAAAFDAEASEFPRTDKRLLAAIGREKELFDSRRKELAEHLANLKKEQDLRTQEMDALDERLKSQIQLEGQLTNESKKVDELFKRGLSTGDRVGQLAREQSRVRTDLLQVRSLGIQARQARSQIDLQIGNLLRAKHQAVLEESQQLEMQRQRLRLQIEADATVASRSRQALAIRSLTDKVRTTIRVRRDDGRAEAQPVTEVDAILPGDVIEVEWMVEIGGGGGVGE